MSQENELARRVYAASDLFNATTEQIDRVSVKIWTSTSSSA